MLSQVENEHPVKGVYTASPHKAPMLELCIDVTLFSENSHQEKKPSLRETKNYYIACMGRKEDFGYQRNNALISLGTKEWNKPTGTLSRRVEERHLSPVMEGDKFTG